MKEFIMIIKKKGIQKTIFYLILMLIVSLPLIVFHKQTRATLKGTCTATNFSQIKKCQNEKRFTTIKTNNIYDVGYNYVVDDVVVGKFLDIDLEGHVILTLVDINTANELLSQNGTRKISGTFSTFQNKVFSETKEKVIKDYIERFTVESSFITEEETRGMFFDYMFNQYDGAGFPFIIVIMIIVIILLLLLFKVIEGIKMILWPNRFVIYGKTTLEAEKNVEKASFEFHNGPYLFQSKSIYITNNYIFDLKGSQFTYHKVNEAIWMYEKSIRRYGLFETGKNLIIKFSDHTSMSLSLTLSERKKIMEILRVKNKNIVTGYDEETAFKYKKNLI